MIIGDKIKMNDGSTAKITRIIGWWGDGTFPHRGGQIVNARSVEKGYEHVLIWKGHETY